MTHTAVSCASLSVSVVALIIAMIYMTLRNDHASSFYGMIATWMLVIAVLTM